MLSEQILNSTSNELNNKNKDHDELSTILGVDDEVPDLRDFKEFLTENTTSNHNHINKYTEGLGLETIDEDKEFKFDPSGNFIFTNAPEEDFMMNSQITESSSDNN